MRLVVLMLCVFSLPVYAAELTETGVKQPGKLEVVNKNQLQISCSDLQLRINEIQMEGKKRMKTEEFLRGYTIDPGG